MEKHSAENLSSGSLSALMSGKKKDGAPASKPKAKKSKEAKSMETKSKTPAATGGGAVTAPPQEPVISVQAVLEPSTDEPQVGATRYPLTTLSSIRRSSLAIRSSHV